MKNKSRIIESKRKENLNILNKIIEELKVEA